jgi:hypothetical protein
LSPEYRQDIETVFTVDREKKWYRALYFWDHRLVGGCFMGKGNRSGKRKYLEAIKGKERYSKDDWNAMLQWTHD